MSLLLRENWGPHLWRVLHTLAHQAGEFRTPLQENDEAQTWNHFLKHLPDIMPCPLCRNHYTDYMRRKSPSILLQVRGIHRKEWLEDCFWSLHNEVNKENGKDIFKKEDLNQYTNVEQFKESYAYIQRMVKHGTELSSLRLMAVKDTMRMLELLRRLYSL
jgi:hypothetical protein